MSLFNYLWQRVYRIGNWTFAIYRPSHHEFVQGILAGLGNGKGKTATLSASALPYIPLTATAPGVRSALINEKPPETPYFRLPSGLLDLCVIIVVDISSINVGYDDEAP